MRLSEWVEQATRPESVSAPVMAVVETLLADLGVEADADCWVVWGDDPSMRYSILAPSLAGLAILTLRPTGSPDGPRGNGKLVRWSKLSVSELTIEAAGGQRIVALQVENQVIKGVDEEADRICEFVRILLAGMENRSEPVVPVVTLAGALAVESGAAVAAALETGTKSKRAPKRAGSGLASVDAAVAPAALEPSPVQPAVDEAAIVPAATQPAEGPAAANADDDTANSSIAVSGGEPDDASEAAGSRDAQDRSDVAAKRRATASALLLPDMGPMGATSGGAHSAESTATIAEALVPRGAVTPVPTPTPPEVPSPEPASNPEPAPKPVPAAEAEPLPPATAFPPIPGREAWVAPHPIVEAEPAPKKPKRWAP